MSTDTMLGNKDRGRVIDWKRVVDSYEEENNRLRDGLERALTFVVNAKGPRRLEEKLRDLLGASYQHVPEHQFRRGWRECCPECGVWVDAHIVAEGPIVDLQLTRTNEKPELLNARLKGRRAQKESV